MIEVPVDPATAMTLHREAQAQAQTVDELPLVGWLVRPYRVVRPIRVGRHTIDRTTVVWSEKQPRIPGATITPIPTKEYHQS